MIRWAVIREKTATTVCLQLQKTPSCGACQTHCEQPLFDLFKLRDGRFRLHRDQSSVLIKNAELLFGEQRQVGQIVGLSVDDNQLLKGAFLSYFLPLLLLVLSIGIGEVGFRFLSWNADGGACLGLALGLLLLWKRAKQLFNKKSLPKVTIL